MCRAAKLLWKMPAAWLAILFYGMSRRPWRQLLSRSCWRQHAECACHLLRPQATVLDSLGEGFETHVIVDAVKAVDAEEGRSAGVQGGPPWGAAGRLSHWGRWQLC